MRDNKKLSILNDFDKRAILNHLKEFDVFDIKLYISPSEDVYYALFYKWQGFTLSSRIHFCENAHLDSKGSISDFNKEARDSLSNLYSSLDKCFNYRELDLDIEFEVIISQILWRFRELHDTYNILGAIDDPICSSSNHKIQSDCLIMLEKGFTPKEIFNLFLQKFKITDDIVLDKTLNLKHKLEG